MLDTLQSNDFIPLLHQSFSIQIGSERIALELVSVNALGQAHQPGFRDPFSLHFLGPASSQYLLQHIYHLEHDQLGTLDLFIVPLGLEAGRMRYEAIFS